MEEDKNQRLEALLQQNILGAGRVPGKFNPSPIVHREIVGDREEAHAEAFMSKCRRALKDAEAKANAKANKDGHYEMVDHPQHYNNYDVEVVDMMESIWGTKATMEWCKMTAYKYRMRMGTKPSENETNDEDAMKKKLLEDFRKEQWYLKKADELKSKLFDKSIDMNN
jgi:hypothetical protein